MTPPTVDGLKMGLQIAEVVQQLGQVYRTTQDSDGNRESVTTHSLMLALYAAHLAPFEPEPLDFEAVLLFALVHDLPEALTGDTPTLRALTPEEQATKDAGEVEAMSVLAGRLKDAPLIVHALTAYERQDTPEARFVKCLDKVMPKLVHALSGRPHIVGQGMTRAELQARHEEQGASLRARAPELRMVHEVFDAASRYCEEKWVE